MTHVRNVNSFLTIFESIRTHVVLSTLLPCCNCVQISSLNRTSDAKQRGNLLFILRYTVIESSALYGPLWRSDCLQTDDLLDILQVTPESSSILL